MTWEAWVMLGLVVLISIALLRAWAGPDTVMLGGLGLVLALGSFSPKFPGVADAVAGFGSKAVVTIGVLFVVAEGIQQTGAMSMLTRRLLGQPRTLAGAQARLMFPVVGLSAFLNNTPIVAMLMPIVHDFSRRTGVAPSKLFMPLSFAAILGGSCTLIGTATNVFVSGEVSQAVEAGSIPPVHLGMFTVSLVGVPAAIIGVLTIMLLSRWLLHDRRPAMPDKAAKPYTFEVIVRAGSAIDGKTIRQAGLRALDDAYLAELDRDAEGPIAVGPEQVLRGGDRLIFVGPFEAMEGLLQRPGLEPAAGRTSDRVGRRGGLRRVEVVVSDRCPLIGRSVKEGNFRGRYHAAILAVHRGGQQLTQKIGDIVLRSGDSLVLETDPFFVDRHTEHGDFYLVSRLDPVVQRTGRAWLALALLAALVILVTTGLTEMVTAALLVGGVMVLTGCVSMAEARASVNWRVLLMMGAALGFGKALDSTGAAEQAASAIVAVCSGLGPWGILLGLYVISMLLTSLIGPLPTVALVFPVAVAAAVNQGLNFTPFAITMMMTAAASFASPTAYQTNLMVYSVGGYRPMDFIKMGLPLNLVVMAVTLTLAPLIWPLQGV